MHRVIKYKIFTQWFSTKYLKTQMFIKKTPN